VNLGFCEKMEVTRIPPGRPLHTTGCEPCYRCWTSRLHNIKLQRLCGSGYKLDMKLQRLCGSGFSLLAVRMLAKPLEWTDQQHLALLILVLLINNSANII